MNGLFKSFNDLSFDSNAQTLSLFDTSIKSSKLVADITKQQEINTWLQLQEISYPIELIPSKFMDGVYLCKLINLNSKQKVKYYNNPQSTNHCKMNIRKALGYLRNLGDFKSNYLWNEDEIFQGRGTII